MLRILRLLRPSAPATPAALPPLTGKGRLNARAGDRLDGLLDALERVEASHLAMIQDGKMYAAALWDGALELRRLIFGVAATWNGPDARAGLTRQAVREMARGRWDF